MYGILIALGLIASGQLLAPQFNPQAAGVSLLAYLGLFSLINLPNWNDEAAKKLLVSLAVLTWAFCFFSPWLIAAPQ